VVTSGDPVRELHIIPHGGYQIPSAYTWALSVNDPARVAQTVWDNYDQSTPALATYLVRSLESHPHRAVAYFEVSRVLVDANRLQLEEQIPLKPYKGDAVLRHDLTVAHKQQLVDDLLRPWMAEIERLISPDLVVVMHHHTYDQFGLALSAYEKLQAGEQRPAGMIFQNYDFEGYNKMFVSAALLPQLVGLLRGYLQHMAPDADVTIDWPYVAPAMLANWIAAKSAAIQSLVYEVRKDLLVGASNIARWGEAVEALVSQLQGGKKS
jgi:predicted N-formylglutamate amidohydrolase